MVLGALFGFVRRLLGRGDRDPVPSTPPRQPGAFRHGPLRVLLIDDNENLRISMRMALELDDLRVAEAPNGLQGVELLLREEHDAAVVDLSMPVMDGYEVARQVRPRRPKLRLIALSGYSGAADLKRAHAAGFDLLVSKPIDPEQLARIIRGANQ